MRESLLEYLYENSERDSNAFVFRPDLRRKTWTFRETAHTAYRFARELEHRSIGRGDRVVIWAENSPQWVAAFYGCMMRGAIAVPLDSSTTPDFAARVTDQTRPKLLLHGREQHPQDPTISKIALDDLQAAVAGHSSEPLHRDKIKPDDTVQIVFTSGTTATPKGVVLTHENILANLEPIENEVRKYITWKRLVGDLKIVCALPLSHVFGQMMGIFIPQMLGATVVFQNRLNPSDVIETIRRERAMVIASVPRVLETLKRWIELQFDRRGELEKFYAVTEDHRSWLGAWWKFRGVHRMFGFKFLCFVTGGATLNDSVEHFWRNLGFTVAQGYGMTETAALISLNNPFSTRKGSLGQALAGRENIKLGTGDEILVRGKNVFAGYWGEAANETEEWLNTGDIGAFDDAGRLYFKGRKKDVIVTPAGLNIYPDDLEAALSSQPGVHQAAVVGTDMGSGPEPVAALILKPECDAAEAISRANETLADYQRIRRWIEWPDADFPRTPTEKVQKNVVADVVRKRLAEKGHAPETTSWLTDVLSRLNRSERVLGNDSKLTEDLALDSMSRVELLSAIEDRYQIDLDEAAFTESTTVGDIEELVRRAGQEEKTEKPRFSYPRWPLRFPVSWIRAVFYELVIFPITCLLAWVNVRGRENLRDIDEPVVFASNHVTYIDPALIISAMPRRFRSRLAIAMDGERLRGYLYPPEGTGVIKRVRWFFTYWLVVTFFNAFPLPRYSGFRQSFAFAGEAIDRGYNILIFPEGELTRDGSMQKFKSGTGLLADGLEAPVVPVAIHGLYELRASGQRGYTKPGSVTVEFGRPIPFDHRGFADERTSEIESRVRALQTPAP